jgi:hypothetical protein
MSNESKKATTRVDVSKVTEAATAVAEKPKTEQVAVVSETPQAKPKLGLKERFKKMRARLAAFEGGLKTKWKSFLAKRKEGKKPAVSTGKFKFTPRAKGLTILGAFAVLIVAASFMPSTPKTGGTTYWVTKTAIDTAVYHEKFDCRYLEASVKAGFGKTETSNMAGSDHRIPCTIDGNPYNASRCSCVSR